MDTLIFFILNLIKAWQLQSRLLMHRQQLSTVAKYLCSVSLYPSHTTHNDLEVIMDSKPSLLVYIKYVIKVSSHHRRNRQMELDFLGRKANPWCLVHFFFQACSYQSLVTESSTESKSLYDTAKSINFKIMYWSYSCGENYFEDCWIARLERKSQLTELSVPYFGEQGRIQVCLKFAQSNVKQMNYSKLDIF